MLRQGVYTTIDPPGSTSTFVLGINPQGDVVGGYTASGVSHGFLFQHQGDFTTIDPPGSTATTATGISSEGDIVGVYFANGVAHGFLARR